MISLFAHSVANSHAMDSISSLYPEMLISEMTRLSRKIAATRGQSRRVALLSEFFHHFLQLGWENDLCNFQMCLNLKHHWTIELDKDSNLASWVFLVYPFTWSPVLHQFISQILPRMFHRSFQHLWGNTIFNLALMCYSVWLGTASLYDISCMAFYFPISFTCWWNMGPSRRLVMQKACRAAGVVIGFPRETQEWNGHHAEAKSIETHGIFPVHEISWR